MAEKSPDVIIREARAGEQALLIGLTLSVWDKVSVAKNITDVFGPLNGHPWTDHKADQIAAELGKADVILVGEGGGEILAFATLLYDRKYATGAIGHLGVSAAAQGKGIGRKMVRECLGRMKRDGMRHARIDALVQNERARTLYESEGFREVGRTVHYFQQL